MELEIEWKREWFLHLHTVKRSHWKSFDNRIKFLEEVKNKLKISHPRDWGKVTIKDIRKLGGGTLLNSYYKQSLFMCLKSIFRGFQFV